MFQVEEGNCIKKNYFSIREQKKLLDVTEL